MAKSMDSKNKSEDCGSKAKVSDRVTDKSENKTSNKTSNQSSDKAENAYDKDAQ